MSKVAIIGAGCMGLSAAYHAAKAGHDVVVFESDGVPGGMAAHFDFGGVSIERYYHFVCKSDQPTFDLMNELGIGDKMRWVPTSMGYYANGRLYDWGNPIALLRFPGLSWPQKIRYGLMMYSAVRRSSPGTLEEISARQWIVSWCGADVYARLWKPLFDLKFYELADNISASWTWTRIKRVGSSRRSMMQEELGYIEGGSETLVNALVGAIKSLGGKVCLGARVVEVTSDNGQVTGVTTEGVFHPFDAVISTVPTPFVSKLVLNLPDESKAAYEAITNIGVACLIFKLKKSVTPYFWVNVIDGRIEIPGLIEFSNLRTTPEAIVYVPYYMPVSNPKWKQSDEHLLTEAFGYIKIINPNLCDDDVLDAKVGRLAHAQPVCPPRFAAQIPSTQTPIAGLQVADTSFYYPEDRGLSESVRYGRLLAMALDIKTEPRGAM